MASGFDRASVEHNLRLLLSASHLGAAWIALEADSPCGYLLAAFVFSLEHGGLMAEIDELFVLPTHRGSGTGSALLRAAEALFMQTGCKQAQLQL
jgi:GNAT superfamily N-acetyltransferase